MNGFREKDGAGLGWRIAAFFSCPLLLACMSGATWARSATRDHAPVTPQFAIGDFDGDEKPDLASVRSGADSTGNALYLIDFRLSTGTQRTFGLTASAGGLRLASRDVNGDHLLDVVVTTSLTDEPVAVFLNDGRGNFTRSDPEAFPAAFRAAGPSVNAPNTTESERADVEWSQPLPASENAGSGGLLRHECGYRAPAKFLFSRNTDLAAWLGRAPPA